MSQPLRGSCLCGRVTFAVRALAPRTAHCHCSMCRKFHGAAFATLATVKTADFDWLSGESALRHYLAANGTRRGFCGECGASLTFRASDQPDDEFDIALGAFDDTPPIDVDAHIYTAYRAGWYCIADRLPRHPEGRGSTPATNGDAVADGNPPD